MAAPNEAQLQAYIDAQVEAKLAQVIADVNVNLNRGGSTKPSKPDTYGGRKDPELWLYGVDLYYAASGITSDFAKISFTDALLRDDALVWRRTTVAPPSWDEWKAMLISAFQPVNPTETARDRLARLRQTGPVRSYASAFRTVTLLIPTITDDEKKDRFIRGLKPKIMNDVKVKAPTTFDEAVQIAVRLDTLDTWRPSSASSSMGGRNPKTNGATPMDLDVNAIAFDPVAVCSSANAITSSHPPRKPLTDREREDFKKKGICFKCRKPGHLARECPESSNSRRQ
jgi:hypothetical protein